MIPKQQLEEGLELLYMLRERGLSDVDIFLKECEESDPAAILEELRRQGLLINDGEELQLSAQGLVRAEGVIRRHRLAEVLMHTVLQVEEREMEETAWMTEKGHSRSTSASSGWFSSQPLISRFSEFSSRVPYPLALMAMF